MLVELGCRCWWVKVWEGYSGCRTPEKCISGHRTAKTGQR